MTSIPSQHSAATFTQVERADFTISNGRLHILGLNDSKGISVVSSLNGWVQEKVGRATKEFKLPSGQIIRVNIKSLQKYMDRLSIPKEFIQAHFGKSFATNLDQLPSTLIDIHQKHTALILKQNMIAQLKDQLKKPLDQRALIIAEIYRQSTVNFALLEEVTQFKRRNTEYKHNKECLISEIKAKPRTISTMYNRKAKICHETLCPYFENERKKHYIEYLAQGIMFSPLASFYRSIQKQKRKASFEKELEQTIAYEKERALTNDALIKHGEHFIPVMDQLKLRNLNPANESTSLPTTPSDPEVKAIQIEMAPHSTVARTSFSAKIIDYAVWAFSTLKIPANALMR